MMVCSDVGLVDITLPSSQHLYEYICMSCCGGSSNMKTVSVITVCVITVCVDVELLMRRPSIASAEMNLHQIKFLLS